MNRYFKDAFQTNHALLIGCILKENQCKNYGTYFYYKFSGIETK